MFFFVGLQRNFLYPFFGGSQIFFKTGGRIGQCWPDYNGYKMLEITKDTCNICYSIGVGNFRMTV